MNHQRRQFLKNAITAGSATLFLYACGSGDGYGTPAAAATTPEEGAKGCANGAAGAISANHGHVLNVSKDDVLAAVDKQYDIRGTSGHTHAVTLTATEFAALARGETVTVTSTVGASHTHTVSVVCA